MPRSAEPSNDPEPALQLASGRLRGRSVRLLVVSRVEDGRVAVLELDGDDGLGAALERARELAES